MILEFCLMNLLDCLYDIKNIILLYNLFINEMKYYEIMFFFVLEYLYVVGLVWCKNYIEVKLMVRLRKLFVVVVI